MDLKIKTKHYYQLFIKLPVNCQSNTHVVSVST